MEHVIDQVINETNLIFEAVLNSNSSVIEDFILVVFDDPNTELLANTIDRNEFKAALHSIRLRNGGNCPEYSMSGIEEALKVSRPNSFVYVFTNAFAEDYEKLDAVRSLSQEKGIQVNFLLTGECKRFKPIQYDVYKDITKATSGQIFHSKKDDVNKIIKYIIETVKYKRTILARKDTKEGENKIQFSVDSKIHNVLIAVSPAPHYEVIDSDGNFIEPELIVQTEKCVVGKIIAKPGIYTVHINDYNQSTVVVSGETTVCFQYGFSTIEPTTLNETSTKPVDATENQFLSIELDNFETDVYLETAELTDIDDNIIKVFNLKFINKKQQFYVTEPFKPPHGMFKIAINGLTKSNEKIRRVSTSTTQYQDPKLVPTPPYTPPTVTISPESPVYVEFNSLLKLKCKVQGYPKPDVIWMDDSGEILSAQKMHPVHLRRDYISVLEIEKVNKNMTVTCTALSHKGDKDSKSVDVKIKYKIYLQVLEHPKDKKVEYNKSAEFKCIVNSWPPAKIIWFKNEKIIRTDENFMMSLDNSTLTIKGMKYHLKGKYHVNVSNTHETKVFSFEVKVPNQKAPRIDKSVSTYKRKIGDSVDMSCRVIQGEPKPDIIWSFYKDGPSHDFEDLNNTQYFYHIEEINKHHSGIYRCEAKNNIDKDLHEMQLIVEYPLFIKVAGGGTFKVGDRVTLDCIVDGSPKPSIEWCFNGSKIEVSSRYKIYKNNSLSFIGSKSDSGNYYCVAENSRQKEKGHIKVTIYGKDELFVEVPKVKKYG
ncbi:unnamed protein product [Euphydryas editha]|uniref:Ig-like domain-containing protein n=1 Tax=Euphydryas editha TaxID=104508 RepID=A0AAU9TQU7_EUPED|nr:unnamed protein product [Euphydryas editha]